MTAIVTVTEDELGEALADRLVAHSGTGLEIAVRMGRKGAGYLRAKLPQLLGLAGKVPVLMLTDLDRQECPPTLIRAWLGERNPPPHLLLRVAVREAEAWLMADRDGFAGYFEVPRHRVPEAPEHLDDPKREMLSILSRFASRAVRRDMVSGTPGALRQGFGYNPRCREFVERHWHLERALPSAESLHRARRRIHWLANDVGG
jgi:hypothetical protein